MTTEKPGNEKIVNYCLDGIGSGTSNKGGRGVIQRRIKGALDLKDLEITEARVSTSNLWMRKMADKEAELAEVRQQMNPEAINDRLKILAPNLGSFERNFIAYKLFKVKSALMGEK